MNPTRLVGLGRAGALKTDLMKPFQRAGDFICEVGDRPLLGCVGQVSSGGMA